MTKTRVTVVKESYVLKLLPPIGGSEPPIPPTTLPPWEIKESKGGTSYVFISSDVRTQPSFFLVLRCTDISEARCPKNSG